MTKEQALYHFWAGFGLPAYDEQTVPDDAAPPYITYETNVDALDSTLALTGSLWYRTTSWEEITAKSKVIGDYIGRGGIIVPYTDGAVWITRRAPFAQRITDPNDDSIRRIYMSISAEYLSGD